MNNKNLFNRKDLKSIRSSLRNRSTSAEAELWDMLKSKKLIIEVNGDPHGDNNNIDKDEIRDNYLASLGFTILRFENRFVFQDPEYIKSEIRKVFNKKLEAF